MAARGTQHQALAVHTFEPVPVLAEPGVPIGGDFRQKPEGRAAVGADGEQFLAGLGILAEEREGKLVARIEDGDLGFAPPGALGDAGHLRAVVRVLALHGCEPAAPPSSAAAARSRPDASNRRR